LIIRWEALGAAYSVEAGELQVVSVNYPDMAREFQRLTGQIMESISRLERSYREALALAASLAPERRTATVAQALRTLAPAAVQRLYVLARVALRDYNVKATILRDASVLLLGYTVEYGLMRLDEATALSYEDLVGDKGLEVSKIVYSVVEELPPIQSLVIRGVTLQRLRFTVGRSIERVARSTSRAVEATLESLYSGRPA